MKKSTNRSVLSIITLLCLFVGINLTNIHAIETKVGVYLGDNKNVLNEKVTSTKGPNITFSVEELENLGASTMDEALQLIQKQSGKEIHTNPKIIYYGLELNPESKQQSVKFMNHLPLKDIEKIEILKDGNQIKYHLSKTLTKDGVTALVTFTLFEEVNLPSKLNPVVSTPLQVPVLSTQIANQVQVIDGQELQALGVTSLEEALNSLSNVVVNDAGGVKTILLRGFSRGNTKVLYDGIDLADPIDPSFAPYFAGIPIEDIKRIEIVLGSNSITNGSGSVAGLINIITKKNQSQDYFSTQMGVNQIQSVLKKNINIKGSNLYLLATQGYNDTQSALSLGSERDSQSNQSITLGFNTKLEKSGPINGSVGVIKEKSEIDDFYTAPKDDPDYQTLSTRYLIKLNTHQSLTDKIDLQAWYGFSSLKRAYDDKENGQTTSDAKYFSNLNTLQVQSNINLNKEQLMTLGTEARLDSGESKGNWGGSVALPKKSQASLGLYTQHRWLNPYLSTQVGGRLQLYSLGSENKMLPIYQLSIFRNIPFVNIIAKATLKTGFKLPSIYQRYNPGQSAKGNPDLKVEKSESKELTLSKKINKIKLSTTYFESDITDQIQWFQTDDDFNGEYRNLSKESTNGFEHNIQMVDIPHIQFAKLSYTTFQSDSQKVPDYKFTTSFGVKKNKLSSGLFINIFGKTKDLPSYSYTNLSINYQWNEKTNLSAKINNLLNTQYETVKGYNEPDRTLLLGIKRVF